MNTARELPREALPTRVLLRGVTLLELMITVAVLAVIAGIGYPSFQELLASQRVRAASSALYDSMLTARSEALKANAPATFVITDLAAGWTVQVSGNVVHSQSALPGLTFSPAAPAIQYGATGRLVSGANTAITVSAAGTSTQRCIRLDTTGRPRLSSEAC